jgi:hypothetical protein
MATFEERLAPLTQVGGQSEADRLRAATLARLQAENYNSGMFGSSLDALKGLWNADLGQYIPQSDGRFSMLNALRGTLRGSRDAVENAPANIAQGVEQTATLPQRAMTSAQNYADTGQYDPAPMVESALMTMGGTSLGAPAGAVGAGPVRKSLLDMGTEARMARAAQQGFDTEVPLYHGTSKDADFKKFKDSRHGTWTTTDPAEASGYALQNDSRSYRLSQERGAKPWDMEEVNSKSRVLPLYAKPLENPAFVESYPERLQGATNYKKAQSEWFDELKAKGHDGVMMPGGVRIDFDNANLRSQFAPFDPANEGRSMILGAGAGDRRGAFAPLIELGDKRVSTRFPTAVKAEEDPLRQHLSIGTEEMKFDPANFEHNTSILSRAPGFEKLKGMSADEAATYIDQAKGNLQYLYDRSPAEMRLRSRAGTRARTRFQMRWPAAGVFRGSRSRLRWRRCRRRRTGS